MKDERISKALNGIDVDEAAKQRMLGSLLEERAKMLEREANAQDGAKTDTQDGPAATAQKGSAVEHADSSDDASLHAEPQRRGFVAAHKVALRVAACLIIVLGVGALALPAITAPLNASKSATAPTTTEIAQPQSDSATASSSASSTDPAATTKLNETATSNESSATSGIDLAGTTLSVDGAPYRAATADEAAGLGLQQTLPEDALGDPVTTAKVPTAEDANATASVRAIAGISQQQAVAVQLGGSADWTLFIAA